MFILENWRTCVFLALLAAIGVQSYRLQGAQGERDVLALEKTERLRRDAMRDSTNSKNKERTDEEAAAARKRALAQRVQSQPTARISGQQKIELAAGGADSTFCLSGGGLATELAGFSDRAANRLNATVAELSQRNAERLTRISREGEEVAAAYRACRAWAMNLAGSAAGTDGEQATWVAPLNAPAVPVLRVTEEGESSHAWWRAGLGLYLLRTTLPTANEIARHERISP